MAITDTEQLDVSFDALLLDEENPRLGSAENQTEALGKLVNLNPNHFRNLMLSIKDNGLDPGDSLYVVENEDNAEDYVVLDGNRRLSAIMVLHNTSLLDPLDITISQKRRLRNAADDFDAASFGDIRCVQFPDRTSANEWIYRRHTGSAEGEGRITWGRLEIARFTNDRSVIDILAFVGRSAEYDEDEWEDTRTYIESRQSSNIERLIVSSAGQSHLGLTLGADSNGNTVPTTTRAPAFLLSVIVRIIEDLRSGSINSRDINTASEIEDYFSNLPNSLQPDPATDTAPTAVADLVIPTPATAGGTGGGGTTGTGTTGGASGAGGTGTSAGTGRTRAARGKRRTLAPTRHVFAEPASEKANNLLEEASRIQLKNFPISAAFILRAFLEMTLRTYAKTHSIPLTVTRDHVRRNKTLNVLGEDIRKHIAADASNPISSTDLRPFKASLLTPGSTVSIQSLNSFVHNQYAIPTPDDLRSAWEAAVPVYVSTYGEA